MKYFHIYSYIAHVCIDRHTDRQVYMFVELPALEGMAIGTHKPPCPEAGDDSNVFAR